MPVKKNDSPFSSPLRVARFCPVCEARASRVDVRRLGGDTETSLVHVACRRCCASALTLVLSHGEEESSVGIVTDLTHEDVMRICRLAPVSIDDVIEAHTFVSGEAWKSVRLPTGGRRSTKTSAKGGKSRRADSA